MKQSLFSGKFNAEGIATGTVDEKLGKISELRFTVHSESENWVILSEVKECKI